MSQRIVGVLLAVLALAPRPAQAQGWQPPPADVVLRVRYVSPMAREDLQVRGDGAFRLQRVALGRELGTQEPWAELGRLPLEDLRRWSKNLSPICKMEPYRDSAVHGQTIVALRIAPGAGCVVRYNGKGEYEKTPNPGLKALTALLAAVWAAPRTMEPESAPASPAPLSDVREAMPATDALRVAWYLGGWQIGEVDVDKAGKLSERTVFDAGFACRPLPPDALDQLQVLTLAAQAALCRDDKPAPKAKGLQIQLLPANLPAGCHPRPLDLQVLKKDPARAALWEALYMGILRVCPLEALLFGQTLQPIALGLPPHRD